MTTRKAPPHPPAHAGHAAHAAHAPHAAKGRRHVVLLHGLGGTRHDWDAVVPLLSPHAEVLALDLPGGGHGAGAKAHDPESLATWLAASLAHHGVAHAVLVGHSLGGRVAGELASRDPRRVEALVLVAPLGAAGYGFTDKLKWKAMSRTAILRGVPEAQMRRALAVGFVGDGEGRRRFVERALAARTGPHGADVARAIEESVDGVLGAPPLAKRLAGTSMPLLLVTGDADPLVPPREAEAILASRPDAKVARLHGQGHYPMLEDPKRLAKVLADFL